MLLQIGYIICLADAASKANIIHRFLIKNKRIICSILAAKLYKMAHEFDIKAVIKAILKKILRFAFLPNPSNNNNQLFINIRSFIQNCLDKSFLVLIFYEKYQTL